MAVDSTSCRDNRERYESPNPDPSETAKSRLAATGLRRHHSPSRSKLPMGLRTDWLSA